MTFTCDDPDYFFPNLAALSFVTFNLLLCLTMSTLFIKSYLTDAKGRTNSKKRPVRRSLLYPTYVMIIVGILAFIPVIIQYILCFIGISSLSTQVLIKTIHLIFVFSIAPLISLIIFFLRLQKVFRDSHYAYSSKLFYILYGMAILFAVCAFTATCLPVSIAIYIGPPTYLLYFIINVTTLVLFVSGLLKVQAGLTSHNNLNRTKSNRSGRNGKKSKKSKKSKKKSATFSDSQYKLLDTMTKYVVLVFVAIVTSLFLYLGALARGVMRQDDVDGGHDSLMWLYWQYTSNSFDYSVNLMCVLLQFRFFGNKSYYKYCTCCHKCCQCCLEPVAVKKMEERRNKRLLMKVTMTSSGRTTPAEDSSSATATGSTTFGTVTATTATDTAGTSGVVGGSTQLMSNNTSNYSINVGLTTLKDVKSQTNTFGTVNTTGVDNKEQMTPISPVGGGGGDMAPITPEIGAAESGVYVSNVSNRAREISEISDIVGIGGGGAVGMTELQTNYTADTYLNTVQEEMGPRGDSTEI